MVDVLTTDHHEVMDLLQQIKAETDPAEQRDLADTVISELVRHSVAEEMFVYPAMRKHLPDGDEAVEHDTEEHKELEAHDEELEAVDAGDAEFAALLASSRRSSATTSPTRSPSSSRSCARRDPPRELVEMAGKVEAAKKVAPTRPHPLAPNNELFHKLVGPGVGLVDRLRDALTGRNS